MNERTEALSYLTFAAQVPTGMDLFSSEDRVLMRFLIDTNVLIPLEPTAPADIEAGTARAAAFVRLANQGRHGLLLHPECATEIGRDRDPDRRVARSLLLSKYPTLEHPPSSAAIEVLIGSADRGGHDWVDNQLLAAVHADAVDYLVTDDGGVRRKAGRLGVADRVLSIDDAVGLLEALSEVRPQPPPAVELVPLHSLDLRDPIFHSLRDDYPGFDDWFKRAAREGRQGWVVTAPDEHCAGVCLLKPHDDQYGLGGRVLKVSTLKVAPEHQGNRYGELLLKTLFDYVKSNSYDHVWVTVFDRHSVLLALFEQFGFERMAQRSPLGELVYKKAFAPTSVALGSLGSLELHIRYGPPFVRLEQERTFLVPIQPPYHRMLFPDYLEATPPLFDPDPSPFGNALRKAYLCNSPITTIEPGSTLLFYRSHDVRAVTAVAVVDSVLRSDRVEELVRFVGQRTVYSEPEIRGLAQSSVLAILFRQDRFVDPPIGTRELELHGVMTRAPQSIMTIRSPEVIAWLRGRIGAQC